MERILVVTNANAGTNDRETLEAALEVLRGAGEVEVVETSTPEELDDVVAGLDAKRGEQDRLVVVAAGGDGTLHAVVNALHRGEALERVCLGLVPLGTGNDFARGMGIPLDPAEAAQLVVDARTTATDLVVDEEGEVVVNNVHLGVGAQASRKAEKWKPRFGRLGIGRLGYVAGALSAGVNPHYLEVTVTVDGVELQGRDLTDGRSVAQVAIGNGSDVGGGTPLIPGADPTDGRITVIVSRARSPWSKLSYIARLRFGSHHLMKEVTEVTGTEVRVEGKPFYCVADGEISGPWPSKTWRLERGTLEMFRP